MSHPVVERILSGEVPVGVRATAAKGLLPIPREDQIELWACLRNDEDPEVRIACRESLSSVDHDEWLQLLPEGDFRPEFFDFAVRVLAKTPDLAEVLVANRSLPDEAMVRLAESAQPALLDRLLDAQNRMLAHPPLVVAMLNNPAITFTQVRRLFDMAEQFFREHSQIPEILETKFGLKIGHAGGAFTVEAPAPAAPAAEAAPAEEAPAVPAEAGEGAKVLALDQSDQELSEDQVKTLYQQLLTMSVPDKVSLAQKGNKEARTLLIRDSNKVVQEAVLDSPKITDGETETIAKMRNLPEELMRKIARNQDWMKRYGVVKGLATNPKTPPGVAVPLVNRLNDFDLKNLQKDKNVSDLVRREAKKLYEVRHAPKKTEFKKH